MSAPWTDITFVGVYYHEEKRLPALLPLARKWFTNLAIGVQTDDPQNDETVKIAKQYADILLIDSVQGLAEPTLRLILRMIKTPWALVISGDEMPDETLLSNMQQLLNLSSQHGYDGFWVRFISSIEGVAYPSEQDNHLRLFKADLGWPLTMHSRPPATKEFFVPPEMGIVHHDRTLDEMMVDYLRYLGMSGNEIQWSKHNRLMMHDACAATAVHTGWDFVRAHEWWPDVEYAAFSECVTACNMEGTWYDCFSHR